MMNRNENQDRVQRDEARDQIRKAYTPPTLTEHGSLEAMTKGGIDPLPPLAWIS